MMGKSPEFCPLASTFLVNEVSEFLIQFIGQVLFFILKVQARLMYTTL
jgi:hypothetical protein